MGAISSKVCEMTKKCCRVNIVESVEGHLHVARCPLMHVGQEEGVNRNQIWVCSREQPTYTDNEALISFLVPKLGKRVIALTEGAIESLGMLN